MPAAVQAGTGNFPPAPPAALAAQVAELAVRGEGARPGPGLAQICGDSQRSRPP